MGQIRLCQTFECSVCRQNWDEGAAVEARFLVKLFGAHNWFVQCCCCCQTVEDFNGLAYQRRWWARKLARERLNDLTKNRHQTQVKTL